MIPWFSCRFQAMKSTWAAVWPRAEGSFYINPNGSAEACPFSPYSDRSLKDHSILEVLSSPFFKQLQEQELVGGEHNGGCALFQQENLVKSLLNS